MNIQTRFFGEIDLQDEQRWNFPKGIPGFEEEKEFALLAIPGNTTFQVLQSINVSNIALIVANPYEVVQNYTFEIDESTIDLLVINESEDIFVLCVLTIKEPFETSTINLQAPVIFQSKTKKAKQMITNSRDLPVRHIIGKNPTVIKREE